MALLLHSHSLESNALAMNQEIQITKQLSQQELLPEDGVTVQDHTSQDQQQQREQAGGAAGRQHQSSKLTVLPLVFLIYFEVAGGPYGSERAVRAAGPLFTLLGFLVFPFLWGVPESLVTAELSAALPGNGGFVRWADLAFGPLAGSLLGTWKYLSCVINIAAYPALVADYLGQVIPAVAGPSRARTGTVVGMTVLLSFVNFNGLSIVGWGAVALGFVSLAPFVLMTMVHLITDRFPIIPIFLFYRDRSAQSAAAAVGRAGDGEEEGLAALLQHAVLEPQLLGQREHDGRRGGAAGADVPAGAGGGRGADRRRLPAAAHGGDRRYGRAAGDVGERLPSRCCRHHRRLLAQVLDRGRRGTVVDRHVRGPAKQRRVPAAGHGGLGPAPGRPGAARHPLPHPVGGHRRLRRGDAGRLLPQLRRRRGLRQRPLQPGHAVGVRGIPVAPRQAARAEAALPRAAPAARASGDVRGALGVPGVRVRGGPVEGARAHGAGRRPARRDEAVQVQGVAQFQHRRGYRCRRGRSPRGCVCRRPGVNELSTPRGFMGSYPAVLLSWCGASC
ncbi:hypothetical protein PVAP13_9NG557000 [Panicum virgatum]|uniref:Polyamine transporter n=1 Tax=Panicum virgatum TaxID=38727 RepID=A0A8T0MTS7_PANVG|nr:hypothetical protein PVAP13_9NG557000 [Panicum virgatum]